MQRFVAALGDQASASSIQRPRRFPRKLHGYFIGFTLVFAAIVLTGFSRTFFIPVAMGTFAKPLIVHIHGAFFFAWTGALVIQTFLAATKRLRAHRRLGSFASWLVLPMLVLGTTVATRDTVNDFRAGGGEAVLSFFYGELADLAMFGLLAGGAMLMRNKPEYHKRWVILGSLGLMGAAVGRIPEVSAAGLYIFIGMIASVAAYDIASRRTVHPATVIGAAILLLLGLTEERIGNTTIWLSTAHQLLRV
ncbi:MAG: hypothetical protein JWP59_159 [Massilia sp.]|nr:hypothetical protein [Massilia sp.]